ncbi:MAG: ABC transporter ATP-binding protein [Bacteroidota bacterium]
MPVYLAIVRMTQETTKTKFEFQLLGRIVGLAKPYKGLFAGTLLLSVILAPVSMLRPFLVSIMVDDYILRNDLNGLYRMAGVFVIVVLLTVLLRYFMIFYSVLLGQNVIRDLRTRVFDHITSLQLRYFDQTPIGKVTTRTINDVETINTVFTQGIISMVADLLGIFAVIGIMLYTSWKLTLLVLVTMPILLFATYIFKEKVKVAFEKVRAQLSNMNAFLQERITGMHIIQIFNAEEQEMRKFKKINRDYTQANLDAITYYAIFFPVVEMINYLALAILVYFGATYVIRDTVSLGALLAFPWYVTLLFSPIRWLADKFNTLQMGMVAAERVFLELDRREQITDNGYLRPDRLKGKVEFDHVDFSYDGNQVILKDVSFKLDEGKTLAIVGSTGSGKTTIINVLARFYETMNGTVRVDGEDIKKYRLSHLRGRMAVVLQDVFLFHGSVMDNITLRDPNISEQKVFESAAAIGADRFIEALSNGYDHVVTERGSNLSMGQRQLISFVRALVFDPDILILDEATSSIDTETEAVIQYAIEKLIDRRSSIIIAHRLSTIRNADHIMVMDKGEIREFGPHEELVQIPDGRYRELYDMQFAKEEVLV